jgi:hypothetical protein
MSWILTPHKDVSFEHCSVPAYWCGEEVICSKCFATLPKDGELREELCVQCGDDLDNWDGNPFARYCDKCEDKDGN